MLSEYKGSAKSNALFAIIALNLPVENNDKIHEGDSSCYKRVYTLPVYTPGPPGPRWNKNDKNTYTLT